MHLFLLFLSSLGLCWPPPAWAGGGPVALASASYVKPDECPERDEFSAGRTCQRKCDNDNDCLNDRKLCLCDGVCGLSCIRPEKECPELPDPPHGQVHLTGR